ncbi:ArsI/CadI family heavy metal resistance metalloenzyme [Peredibacter starrii]|uniref:ArsI/CadI family heavy metal resistance metalloenzyme n=1 Tax=Peredibacter starrii TaxID=28202 RepID=A0AAX4HML6_9BACT|nr:ArsI/CadI family heavy metal resistance metalloenzyme [Peredibacter starrii]WPU64368.1 ArsI/CadI family heavy metal resistance metalloenzyme [Peredibacter starrii]
MKRFHIHVGVKDIHQSVQFYSTLFGQKPTKQKEDYAKWMLEDPRINFAISTRSNEEGVDHLGFQVDEGNELSELTERLKNADLGVYGEGTTTCCYAESNKAWVKDPSGIAWETYQTMADAEVYSEKPKTPKVTTSACCVPKTSTVKSCC